MRLVEEGENVSRGVSTNLKEIFDSVSKAHTIVSEIAAASQEQSRGIEQVNQAVAQIDQVTQQAAANSEESSSAAEELSTQAEQLAAMLGRFRIQRDFKSTPTKLSLPNARQIPAGAKKPAPKLQLSPQEVIPLDDDPDFKDF